MAAEPAATLAVDGEVATIALTRPDRANSMNAQFFADLGRLLDEVGGRSDIRSVVLVGEGRHFCAGGDLDHPLFDEDDDALRRAQIEDAYVVTQRMLDLPQPVVCAVQGRIAGAGLALVLSSDLRVAAESAVFSLDFVRLGLAPDMGVNWLLASTIGTGRALDFALTGDLIRAAQAHEWGIISRVVPDGEERAAAHALAVQLAGHPRAGMAAIRRLVRTAPFMDRAAAFDDEITTMTRLSASADARARLAAFRARAREAKR